MNNTTNTFIKQTLKISKFSKYISDNLGFDIDLKKQMDKLIDDFDFCNEKKVEKKTQLKKYQMAEDEVFEAPEKPAPKIKNIKFKLISENKKNVLFALVKNRVLTHKDGFYYCDEKNKERVLKTLKAQKVEYKMFGSKKVEKKFIPSFKNHFDEPADQETGIVFEKRDGKYVVIGYRSDDEKDVELYLLDEDLVEYCKNKNWTIAEEAIDTDDQDVENEESEIDFE